MYDKGTKHKNDLSQLRERSFMRHRKMVMPRVSVVLHFEMHDSRHRLEVWPFTEGNMRSRVAVCWKDEQMEEALSHAG